LPENARLSNRKGTKPGGMTAVQWLLKQPVKGTKTKRQIDSELKSVRDDWA
jgi:hypothetical protein